MPLLRHLLQQEPVHQNNQQENPHKVYRTKLITLTSEEQKTEVLKYWVWTMWHMLQHFPTILPEPPFGHLTV
jgi:hypothetical protein